MDARENMPLLVLGGVVAQGVVLLILAIELSAQQSAVPNAKPMVPANPAVHTPPEQPIPYSHKKHLSFGLQCKECHTNPEPGKLMTFPDTAKCMQCHVTIAKSKPAIQKLAGYAKSNQPIPWVPVYRVLPGVNWSHRPHLLAEASCQTCHGNLWQMDQVSEVTSVTTMYSCLNCHELSHAKAPCDTCHKN
jgi:Cytochrome c3/Cytochrome c7 and related cytochrome c